MSVSIKSKASKGSKSSSKASAKSSASKQHIEEERNEPVEFMPREIVSDYQDKVTKVMENADEYTPSDQSEAYERLGVAQYYYGTYRAAIPTLQQSLDLRDKLKYNRSNARILMLLGLAQYRLGDLEVAGKSFEAVIKGSLKMHPDLAATAYGNMALIHQANTVVKQAVDNAKKGLELAMKCAKGDKGSPRVLQLARIIISIYIKVNEFSKAEALLSAFAFPKHELIVLQAGLKFGQGQIADASSQIEVYLEDKESERLADIEREKEEELERVRIEEENTRKAEEEAKRLADLEAGAGAQTGSITVPEVKIPEKEYQSDEESEGTEMVLEEEEEEEDEEEEKDEEEMTPDQIWKEKTLKEEAEVSAKEQGLADQKFSSYTKRKKRQDDLLVEAKLLYNLSVLTSGQYKSHQSVITLDKAKKSMEKYMLASHVGGTDDETAMRQTFYDAKLNVIPLCATRDENSEPLIALSQILYSKAEQHLHLANDSKRAGLVATQGEVFNRGLPSIHNGNDAMKEEKRSQFFEDQFKDPNILEAEKLFKESMDIIDGSSSWLSRDIETVETVKEIIKAKPEKTEDEKKAIEEGEEEEEFEEKEFETISTIYKPIDLSLMADSVENYSPFFEMQGGISSYKAIGTKNAMDMKKSYGIALNLERGTKGHQNTRVDYTKQYVSNVHDPVSVRTEIIPLVSRHGRDDVSMWIEWALTSTGGIGMGIMGLNFNLPTSKEELQKQLQQKKDGVENEESAADKSAVFKILEDSVSCSSTVGQSSSFPSVRDIRGMILMIRAMAIALLYCCHVLHLVVY